MADTYDSMAEGRTYSRAMSHLQIMEVLERERGRQHDPGLFSDFESMIERSEYRTGQD